jgi:DNA-binding NtrC family response regulator
VINNNPTAFRQLPSAKMNEDKTLRGGKTVQRGKVLIVDDEIDVVRTLQTYLSENGYKTFGCISAKGALEAIKKYDFDLLLIDLVMPEMNGIELLKAALEIDPHLIGIIITGKGTIQTAVDAMKAGAFDYLLKPFKFEMLSPILDRAMKVRELMKSEDKCRSLAEELHYKVRELQNTHDKGSGGELEVFELREEVESLKEELEKYKEAEKNMFFNGSGFGNY